MAVVHNYLPGDPLLIDKIVYELKSQGIFDQFRKECIADVDTKPAYQNLRQRVEGSVSGFLSKQKWSPDMNKNQVREMLRKNIYESGFLETGVERIVDQVVNPKMNSIFLPKVTEVVYKFLGIEKPTSEKKENLKLTFNNDNLMPTDLEAVSPESEKKFDIDNHLQNLDDSKIDEDESPPFEPLEEKPIYIPPEENSVDSHLSGISGLMSHDSNHSQEFSKPIQMEISNQDSMLSKQSSEGRLSIVMSDDNETKMEICEDSLLKTPKANETKPKEFEFNQEILMNNNTSSSSTKRAENKSEDKPKSNEKSSKSHDKHKSRHDSGKSDRKDDRDKRSDKDRKEHRDKHVSSRDKGKEKDRKDSKSGSSKSEKDKSEKSEKDRSKSSSNSSNRHSSSSKDKSSSSSSSKKDSSSSSSKDRGDKSKSTSSSSKDKDSKHKDNSSTSSKSKGDSKSSSKHDSSSKSDKHKKDDKHRSDRHSSSSRSRDKDKKDSKKDKKASTKDDHFGSKKKSERRSTDRDSNDGQSGLKSSSSSFDSSSASSQTQNKSQESSNSNSNSNNGSGDSGNSDAVEECIVNNTPVTILNDKLDGLEEVAINAVKERIEIPPALKLIKPKFASNIHEAKRLMKIRKQLTLLEKQNFLDVSRMLEKKKKIVDAKDKPRNKLKNKINNRSVVLNNHSSAEQNRVPATPEPLSPPLKSSVVSAATWDALEAKLHESLNYSTCYDVADAPEEAAVPVSYCKDDCLFLEPNDSEKTKRYMKHAEESIKTLQDAIDSKRSRGDEATPQKATSRVPDQVNNVLSRGTKRKFSDYQSDVKNNNKKFNTHHIEVHENFSLPLSPAESENSIDKKSDTSESSYKSLKKTETEFADKPKKSVRGVAKTQRYSSEDLYKPRPVFGGSRRRNGRNLGVD